MTLGPVELRQLADIIAPEGTTGASAQVAVIIAHRLRSAAADLEPSLPGEPLLRDPEALCKLMIENPTATAYKVIAALSALDSAAAQLQEIARIAGQNIGHKSAVQAVQDLKADNLRLHREKMEQWERAQAIGARINSVLPEMRKARQNVCSLSDMDRWIAQLGAEIDGQLGFVIDIQSLVDRFLEWPLPPSVCSDLCATEANHPHRSGTNLLSAGEARQMFEYLCPDAPRSLAQAVRAARGGEAPTPKSSFA